jgi:RNA polymerase sigma-70 factor (ECF subfamily)
VSTATNHNSLSLRSDDYLLGCACRGNREALDGLFERHRTAAYRVAYSLLQREADALDAVQEAFIKVLRHLPTFRRRSAFKTWLLRIVHNAALDLRRRRERLKEQRLYSAPLVSRDDHQPAVWINPLEGMERAELRERLDRALARLPEIYRQAFVLFVEARMSYREVAAFLDVPIGTVMSRLYYARRKLRAWLTDCRACAEECILR